MRQGTRLTLFSSSLTQSGGQCISAVGAFGAVALTDKMRRRPVLIYGTAACAVFLAINGGLSTAFGKSAGPDGVYDLKIGQGALAAYYLFNFTISFTYTPLQALYPVEWLVFVYALDGNVPLLRPG